MLKFAKIIDDTTKRCEVGIGDDVEYYIKAGFEQMDVEQSYLGDWYIAGYAPEKPEELIIKEEIEELKRKIADSNYAILEIAEGSATAEEYAQLIEQRKQWRARINELEG